MYSIIFNIIIFVAIFFLGFLSLTGFGKLMIRDDNQKAVNFFDLQIYGSINLLILGFIINLTIGTNNIINIFIFVFGICLYIFYKRKLNKIRTNQIIVLLISVLSLVLISKTHEDFVTYHFFSIYELFNNNIRIGVSKLNERFFHSSLFAFNQSLFIFPYLNYKIIHFPIVYIYLSTLGYFFYSSIIEKKSNTLFFSIFCIIILLVKFNRLSEFGYDYIAQFILLIVFHKIYYLRSNYDEISTGIIFFIFAVLIKPISLFFLPILVYTFLNNKFNFYRYIISNRILIILSLVFVMIITSFLRTGCVFYPANFTCFGGEKIFWSKKEYIKDYSKMVGLWAKGFYHQKDSKYNNIEDANTFNQNFNWFKFWIEKHFFYKVFEFTIIVLLAYIITFIYFTKEKSKNNIKNPKLIFLFLSTLSVIFWLLLVPQFRFGFSLIMILIFLLISNFLETNVFYNKKKFFRIIVICIILLNLKNIIRINSEFERNDFYRYSDFPFYNEPKINQSYEGLNVEKFLSFQIIKY